MTAAADPQIVPRPPAAAPALRASDQGVASALESVLSQNTRRVYGAQWRLFTGWCAEVGLVSLPAEPLAVARYLAARAGSGASIARCPIGPALQDTGSDGPGNCSGLAWDERRDPRFSTACHGQSPVGLPHSPLSQLQHCLTRLKIQCPDKCSAEMSLGYAWMV